MHPEQVIELIVLAFLLILSAFFSSAETALTTVSKHKLRAMYEEEGNKKAKRVLKLVENPGKLLSAILIGNNVVNLSASALTTIVATAIFGNRMVGVATGVLTFLVLIFGEITPKTLASVYNVKFSFAYSGIIKVLMVVLTPFIWILDIVTGLIFKILRVNPDDAKLSMTESELRTIVNVSHEEGVIEGDEKEMITNVVDFGDSLTREIMIPRVDMITIDVEASYKEVFDIYLEEQYTRLPVYENTKDNIIGILNIKDLFFYRETKGVDGFTVRELMREPHYAYEFQKTSDLMDEMRSNSVTLAIVLDEYGATAGMVTLEDLLEEIVGEIKDEYDAEDREAIRKISENTYEVDGSTKIDDMNDVLGTQVESEDYDSVGGHIIGLLDHLPHEGENVKELVDSYMIQYRVKEMDKNRIETITVILTPVEIKEEE